MNALFIAIVVLGIIFLVMICNSNKDKFNPLIFRSQHGRGDIDWEALQDRYNSLDQFEKCRVHRIIYDSVCKDFIYRRHPGFEKGEEFCYHHRPPSYCQP